jgi:glyoxalase family protein
VTAHRILGLHHVTATADGAQEDVDFYADLLGLRLVKKTVNFDNHSVFHFYYGDRVGTPGTLWTTFPYRGWAVPVGTKGAGQIRTTSFSVHAGTLDFWRARLEDRRVGVRDVPARFDEQAIEFDDPSGLVIELVASSGDARKPWTSPGLDEAVAIRGLHSVGLIERSPDRTVQLMTEVLGFTVEAESTNRMRLTVGGRGAGHTMDLLIDPAAPAGRNGLGTVHHVAMAIGSNDEQLALRDELLHLGFGVTEVRDRQYFKSIYFREPGGVLFEVATIGPGFLVDEAEPDLGRGLKLPPWEEPSRASIEATLPRIVVR